MSNGFRSVVCLAVAALFIGTCSLVALSAEPGKNTLGAQLYEKFCSGCHSPLKESNRAGRSVGRVRSAIRMFGQHKDVSSLSDEQINLIALALKDIKQ